jgi:hypothetical protein
MSEHISSATVVAYRFAYQVEFARPSTLSDTEITQIVSRARFACRHPDETVRAIMTGMIDAETAALVAASAAIP